MWNGILGFIVWHKKNVFLRLYVVNHTKPIMHACKVFFVPNLHNAFYAGFSAKLPSFQVVLSVVLRKMRVEFMR
ncbi:hypothetical protein MASR2M18_17900 [Ignavibacteria bacterium]